MFCNVASSTDCCNVSIRPWMNARCAIVSLSLLALELPPADELFNRCERGPRPRPPASAMRCCMPLTRAFDCSGELLGPEIEIDRCEGVEAANCLGVGGRSESERQQLGADRFGRHGS